MDGVVPPDPMVAEASSAPSLARADSERPARARPPKVLAAMSGGVDSALATSLLVEQGFDVTGSMLRFWPDDREDGAFDLCCSPEAAFDARRMADRLEVPFYLLDARESFERVVIEPFVPGYEAGRTPNPCVWCNREIKFGDFVRRAQRLGCEFMATGHYVRRVDGPAGVELHRGVDAGKDQSYFLWALPRDILPYLLFPLGELTKERVRSEAVARGLSVAWKRSSSGLCFIPRSVRAYLHERVPDAPGPVVDASRDRTVVGEHRGVAFYTVGQKRGLGLWRSHEPRYVIDLEPASNTVVVGTREMCRWRKLEAERASFLCGGEELPARVMAQIRYRQRPASAELVRLGDDRFALRFDEPQDAVTEGQSAVVYDGDRLLGGGVITGRGEGGAERPH